MSETSDRRAARRFTMALPVVVRFNAPAGLTEQHTQTRDVSFRGLFFFLEGDFETGSSLDFVLTLPRQITLSADVCIRCSGKVVRVEPSNGRRGIAACIERYEFLPESRVQHAGA